MNNQSTNAAPYYVSRYKIRYYDTDRSTTTFFSNYPKWFDSITIIDYLEEKGIDWLELLKRNIDVSIAHVSFDYKNPLFLNDEVDMALENVQLGNKSIRFSGSFYRHPDKELIAQGEVVYVFVDSTTRQSIPIPEDVRKILP